MRSALRITLCVLALLQAAGCASTTYESPGVASLPVAQVAVLTNLQAYPGTANIIHVDGKSRGVGFIKDFRLAPGLHTIHYEWTMPNWHFEGDKGRQVTLLFEALPGHRYLLNATLQSTGGTKGAFKTWIEDAATGQRVDRGYRVDKTVAAADAAALEMLATPSRAMLTVAETPFTRTD